MDPTGDTANGGGVCDVAIDNKDDDDTAMDIKGDYSTLEKETIDNKDESDYAKDIEPGNGVNAHEPEDMMVDDDGEADGARDEQQNEEEDMEGQEEGSQGSDEANNVDQNNDAQSDEDFGLAKFEALDQGNIWVLINSKFRLFCSNIFIIPRRSRRDIVLASSVRPSVRPHFLSVRNHISVPIGQILFILGTNDKYHGLLISYKFGQNRPLNT